MKKIIISEDELEQMNYNDVAYVILKERNKKMKIMELYDEIGNILGFDTTDKSHLTDLFELLSTDKRFIMLEEGYWDLRIKHDTGMIIDSEEDDDEEMILEDESGDAEYEENDEIESDDDVEEDDLSDLVIIDDGEEDINI